MSEKPWPWEPGWLDGEQWTYGGEVGRSFVVRLSPESEAEFTPGGDGKDCAAARARLAAAAPELARCLLDFVTTYDAPGADLDYDDTRATVARFSAVLRKAGVRE